MYTKATNKAESEKKLDCFLHQLIKKWDWYTWQRGNTNNIRHGFLVAITLHVIRTADIYNGWYRRKQMQYALMVLVITLPRIHLEKDQNSMQKLEKRNAVLGGAVASHWQHKYQDRV